MMFFKNMKISTKLLLFVALMEVLIVCTANHGINVARNTDHTYQHIITSDAKAASDSYALGMNFSGARTYFVMAMGRSDRNAQQQAFDRMEQYFAAGNVNLQNLVATAETKEAKEVISKLTDRYETYHREAIAAVKDKMEGRVVEEQLGMRSEALKMGAEADDLSKIINNIADMAQNAATKESAEATENIDQEMYTIIVVALVLVVISFMIGLFFSRNLAKRLGHINEAADRIANGDLATEVVTSTGDELGDAAASFEIMRQRVHESIAEIHNASDQVAAGAKNVSDASTALSQGASEQAASVEELSASITEIASQTASNATSANQANDLTAKAKKQAELGNADMRDMLNAMEEINVSSANISKIIKVIDEIAFQTNILALNAAVEAARAGQHGKGFAVVAEEVRNLAARSAKAAKETTDMIEGSIEKVGTGREIANKTAQALSAIVGDVGEVADIVGNIAKASNEQKLALEQINQGVQQVSQVVQANSATSEESASASQQLSAQANRMREIASKFKLSGRGTGFGGGFGQNNGFNAPMNNSQPTTKKPTKIALTEDEGFGKY